MKLAIVLSAGLATAASAQYSVVAFDNSDVSLKLINVPGGPPASSVQTLHTFADPDTRILSIDRNGGRWYMDNSPFPPTNPNEAGIIQIDNLFGVPSASFLAQGDSRFTESSLRYDAALGHLVTVAKPTSDHPDPKYFGVIGVNTAGGAITDIYEEPGGQTRPFWRRANDLVHDINSSDYFVVALNGGIYNDPNGGLQPPDRNFGSTIHRLSIDPNTLAGTESLLVDLSDTGVTGLADPITFARSIDINPNNGDLYVADGEGDIWVVHVDGNGDFAGIDNLVTGFDADRPGGVRYNPYNDTVMFSNVFSDSLWQVNTDGSGLVQVIENFDFGAFYIIPAPSSMALIGVAGLAAARRRR
ncbi:MAG: hypothetical protein H6811_07055 [Phycisphaeraceae bacterium]|nr:hypothetical protein [Phycisphaeraceae bacterium]